MSKTLYQLKKDDFEELCYFNNEVSTSQIKEAYKGYERSEFDSFEDYVEEWCPDYGYQRVFVEEIYL